jgi:formate dehydrogenase major subunit
MGQVALLRRHRLWFHADGGKLELGDLAVGIQLRARADRAVSEDCAFMPFAFVEAAANVLTNPQLDPYGKIPEFKFSAVRVEPEAVAAE